MINNKTFYTTVDNHRLQIADENSHYGGDINSYNNCLTRVFAKLFRQSMEANFNGKTRSVNKNAYAEFLKNNGIQANKENIHNFVDFNKAMMRRNTDWTGNGYMRDHLTSSKSHKLFKKLVFAMYAQNINKAQKLAGQGANIEEEFWNRDNYGLSFNQIQSALPTAPLQFTATRYNPLLLAVRNGLSEFAQFLIKIGASRNFVGETTRFTRTISHIDNQYHVHTGFIPVHHHHGYRHGPRHHIHHHGVHHVPYAHVDRQTIVHYNDAAQKLSTHFVDANLKLVTQPANQ